MLNPLKPPQMINTMNLSRYIRTTLCLGILLGSIQFLHAQVFGKLQYKAPLFKDLSANNMYSLENIPNHRSQLEVVNLYSGSYSVQVICRWKDMYRAKDMGTDRSFLIRMGDVVQLDNNLSQMNRYRYDTQTAAQLSRNLSNTIPYCIDRRYTTTFSTISNPTGLGTTRGGNTLASPQTNTSSFIHVVKPKETLYSIGQQYNIPHQELMAVNGMVSSDIYPNQRLRIERSGMRSSTQNIYRSPEPLPIARTSNTTYTVNTSSPTIVRYNTFPQQGAEVTHEVQKGETLFSIAQQYGLTTKFLAGINGIKDPKKLAVGTRLQLR